MESSIDTLEDNMLNNVKSLKDCSFMDLKDLGLPLGLVKEIMKRLEKTSSNTHAQVCPF